jgi:hypothetical protein
MNARFVGPLAFGAWFAISGWAHAQDLTPGEKTQKAEQLFVDAKALVKDGKAADACPKFEESLRLDPAVGTQFNLADCYDRTQRYALAWRSFRDLAEVLFRVGDERAPQADSRARALDGKLSRIVVRAPWASRVTGLEITLDGKPLIVEAGKPEVVDAGTHRVHAQASDKKPFDASFDTREGELKSVDVPELADVSQATSATVAPPPSSGQKVAALVVAGVGLVALGTGVVLGALGKSQYDDAVDGCHDLGDRFSCPTGRSKKDDAQSAQTLGTVGSIVGGVGLAALVTGGVLFFTAPRASKTAAVRAVPWGGTRSAGLSLTGRF